jgi:hypothetical protein
MSYMAALYAAIFTAEQATKSATYFYPNYATYCSANYAT